ncbi:MAG: hypothetical protein QM674_03535, partial [Burkholderiaceae bacterium]
PDPADKLSAEMFLGPRTRLACSAWSFVPELAVESGVTKLASGLASGIWDSKHGYLRLQPDLAVVALGGRLAVVHPAHHPPVAAFWARSWRIRAGTSSRMMLHSVSSSMPR